MDMAYEILQTLLQTFCDSIKKTLLYLICPLLSGKHTASQVVGFPPPPVRPRFPSGLRNKHSPKHARVVAGPVRTAHHTIVPGWAAVSGPRLWGTPPNLPNVVIRSKADV